VVRASPEAQHSRPSAISDGHGCESASIPDIVLLVPGCQRSQLPLALTLLGSLRARGTLGAPMRGRHVPSESAETMLSMTGRQVSVYNSRPSSSQLSSSLPPIGADSAGSRELSVLRKALVLPACSLRPSIGKSLAVRLAILVRTEAKAPHCAAVCAQQPPQGGRINSPTSASPAISESRPHGSNRSALMSARQSRWRSLPPPALRVRPMARDAAVATKPHRLAAHGPWNGPSQRHS
jgi:hypothetical protein